MFLVNVVINSVWRAILDFDETADSHVPEHDDDFGTNSYFRTIRPHPAAILIFWRNCFFLAYLRVSKGGDRFETNFHFRTIRPHPAAILNCVDTTNFIAHFHALQDVAMNLRQTLIIAPYDHTRQPFWIVWTRLISSQISAFRNVANYFGTNFHFRTKRSHLAAILKLIPTIRTYHRRYLAAATTTLTIALV